jgi:alkanesulfonate monooxygenase SsuD/methylene tetrahydromethanopterin reductase-like flavin-dependent oxidoreductase (luciferase family)
MKLGIFSVVDHYPGELPRTVGEFYREQLEQVEAAEEWGFDSFWIAEHHFHEYGAVPSPPVWLAAAAERTHRLRLGAAVAILPFRNPLHVAEEYAMVDVLSGGRLNFGAGSGYLKHEFEGHGIDPEQKRDRFDEALDIVLRAWRGERVSFEGTYHRVRDVQLNVRPMQWPHPPVWIAILRYEAAPFVARKGFPIMLVPYATTEHLDELRQATARFRQAYLEAGHPAERLDLPVALHTYVTDSRDAAAAEAREAMDRYVRTRLYAKTRPYETLLEKNLIVTGSPEECLRTLRLYRDAGMTHLLAIVNYGGLPHKRVLRSMERLAKEVLPALRRD